MRFFVPLLLLFPLHVFAAVVISEIMYDLPSPGADTGREWVEITNTGTESIDLSGWKFFEGDSNHGLTLVSGETILNPGGLAVIADNVEKFKTDNSSFSGILFDSSFSLNNTGETLTLRNADLLDIDSVTYSKESGGSGDGNSLQKINGVWSASTPTPGITNTSSLNSSESSTPNTIPAEQTQTQTPSFILSASIKSGTQTTVGKPITFEGQAKKDNDLLASAQYIWTFGDEQGNEGKNVSHVYASKGIYTVALNVFYEGRGASDSISVTVSEEQLKEIPPVQSVPQTTSSSRPSQGEKIGQKTQSGPKENTIKQTYILPEKSASMTPESITPEMGQTAALAAKESPLMPWLVGLGAIVGIPIAFVFLAKPKKNEADEIKIIE